VVLVLVLLLLLCLSMLLLPLLLLLLLLLLLMHLLLLLKMHLLLVLLVLLVLLLLWWRWWRGRWERRMELRPSRRHHAALDADSATTIAATTAAAADQPSPSPSPSESHTLSPLSSLISYCVIPLFLYSLDDLSRRRIPRNIDRLRQHSLDPRLLTRRRAFLVGHRLGRARVFCHQGADDHASPTSTHVRAHVEGTYRTRTIDDDPFRVRLFGARVEL